MGTQLGPMDGFELGSSESTTPYASTKRDQTSCNTSKLKTMDGFPTLPHITLTEFQHDVHHTSPGIYLGPQTRCPVVGLETPFDGTQEAKWLLEFAGFVLPCLNCPESCN